MLESKIDITMPLPPKKWTRRTVAVLAYFPLLFLSWILLVAVALKAPFTAAAYCASVWKGFPEDEVGSEEVRPGD